MRLLWRSSGIGDSNLSRVMLWFATLRQWPCMACSADSHTCATRSMQHRMLHIACMHRTAALSRCTRISLRIAAETFRQRHCPISAASAKRHKQAGLQAAKPKPSNTCEASGRHYCSPAAAHFQNHALRRASRGRAFTTAAPSVLGKEFLAATTTPDVTVDRNNNTQQHTPVLLDEILGFFEGRQLRTFVDGTLGAAGHSCAVSAAHQVRRYPKSVH